ncbi:MAG: copper resistance protein B [Rickettsiales bacterium]
MKNMHEDSPLYAVFAKRTEYRVGEENAALWDVDAWYGTPSDKFYVQSEGENDGDRANASTELYWNHAVSPFWDVRLGARYDAVANNEDRAFLAAGYQGTAPYMVDVEAAAYVSDRGEASARIEMTRDVYLTQKIAVQPRFETELAFSDAKRYAVAQGVTRMEAGLRVRYEIRRRFAPYLGAEYGRALGESAGAARARGDVAESVDFLLGAAWRF